MSETAVFMALLATASTGGVDSRRHYLREHGPHEMGWSYANILEVAPALLRQLDKKGYFRIYLYVTDTDHGVRYAMKITTLRTSQTPEVFTDPVDERRYVVHSKMTISTIEELVPPMDLSGFLSVDKRKPDIRHLTLGFLFVVDPEV